MEQPLDIAVTMWQRFETTGPTLTAFERPFYTSFFRFRKEQIKKIKKNKKRMGTK
jgi:hypothetical protein